jgi:hypothetical protein
MADAVRFGGGENIRESEMKLLKILSLLAVALWALPLGAQIRGFMF